ncbi:MAG: hypothetical protein ABMA15_06960 [Vicinamibacterales bacterium]
MPDFNVRSDAVNVEHIMEQIRARISEKRGVDYTDAQIRELASVKLEKFLDPRGVRSDLLEQYRRAQPPYAPPELPNYAFEADTLFESTRGPLRFIRKLLMPVLKLFFNPNPLIQALHIQAGLNTGIAEREAKRDAARYAFDQLHYEVMHNLVVETTRLGIEVKNITMRLESLASRLEFNERRARALESVVVYKPATEESSAQETRRDEPRREEPRRDEGRRDERRRDEPRRDDARRQEARRQETRRPEPPPAPPVAQPEPTPVAPAEQTEPAATSDQATTTPSAPEGPGQRSRRRRRRRGRRGGGSAAVVMGGAQPETEASLDEDTGGDEEPGADSGADGGADATADAVAAVSIHASAPDSRTARPEPFEHTFGAQAHPAETATSDPTHSASTTPGAPLGTTRTSAVSAEPASADPSATPEQ